MAQTVDISKIENPARDRFPNLSTWNIANLISGGSQENKAFSLIDLAFFAVGIIFFASLVIASLGYIFSDGTPEKIQKATNRIVTSLIGLAIVLASFVIVRLVLGIYGLDNPAVNPLN